MRSIHFWCLLGILKAYLARAPSVQVRSRTACPYLRKFLPDPNSSSLQASKPRVASAGIAKRNQLIICVGFHDTLAAHAPRHMRLWHLMFPFPANVWSYRCIVRSFSFFSGPVGSSGGGPRVDPGWNERTGRTGLELPRRESRSEINLMYMCFFLL